MSDLIANSLTDYNTYKNNASSTTNGLQNSLSSDFTKASDDELMAVCKDFEAYFVEQMYKSMEKMSKIDPKDEDSSSASAYVNYFKDEMYAQYAKSTAESNGGTGLGIAQTLFEQMKRNYGSSNIPSDTSNN